MNAVNLILSILGGVGVFFIYSGITESFFGASKTISSSTNREEARKPTFKNKIESLLYQARAPISYSEFLATSFAIGLMIAFAFFFITKGILASIFALFVGMAVYYIYLIDRRDKMAIEYEKAQPEIADIIAASFRSRGYNLTAVLNQVIQSGPEIAREDWIRIAAAVESKNVNDLEINRVLAFRNSPGLWKIVESILLFRTDLERLAPLMNKIKRDLSKEVAIEREIVTEMVGPRKQLLYVAIMPAVLLVIFILFSPEIGAFYSSLMGQIVMIAVLAVSGAIYIFGANAAAKKMRIRKAEIQIPGGKMVEAEHFSSESVPLHLAEGQLFDDEVDNRPGTEELPDSNAGFGTITESDFNEECR